MADDIVQRLRKAAQFHEDPAVRAEAQRRLARRGEGAAERIRSMESGLATAAAPEPAPSFTNEQKNDPRTYANNPAMRAILAQKQGERDMQRMESFADSASFGLAGRAAGSVDPDYARRAQVRDEAFGSETGAKVARAAGYLAPGGAAGVIGRGVGAAARPIAALAQGSGRLARAGAALGEGAAAGGLTAGAEAAARGEDVGSAATEGAAFGAAGAAIAKGVGAAGRAATKYVKDPRGKTARLLRDQERGKAFLDSPAGKSLPEGKEGVEHAAYNEMQAAVSRSTKAREKAGQMYEELTQEALEEAADTDLSGVRDHLYGVRRSMVDADSGVSMASDAFEAAMAKVDQMLSPKELGGTTSVKSLMNARKLAKTRAKFGARGEVTDEMEAWREVYDHLNDAIDSVDETGSFRQARKIYADTLQREREINGLLTGRNVEALADAQGNTLTGANRLAKIASSGGIGAAGSARQKLSQLDPELAGGLDRVAAKNAAEELAAGAPRSASKGGLAAQYGRPVLISAAQKADAMRMDLAAVPGASPNLSREIALGRDAMRPEDAGPPTPADLAAPAQAAATPVRSKEDLIRIARESAARKQEENRRKAEAVMRRTRPRRRRRDVTTVDPIDGSVIDPYSDEKITTVDPY